MAFYSNEQKPFSYTFSFIKLYVPVSLKESTSHLTKAHSTFPVSSSQQSNQSKQVLCSKVHQQRSKIQESPLSIPREKNNSRLSNSQEDLLDIDPVVIDTVYRGVSSSPGSLFFDVTCRKESDKDLYKLAFGQLEDFVGQLVHRSGANRYWKVKFDIEKHRSYAFVHGLKFDNGKMIAKPVHAIEPGSVLKKANLQH